MGGATPLLPLYVFMVCRGKILPFMSTEWLGQYTGDKSEKPRGKGEGGRSKGFISKTL
jgi:hypothetical protein